MECQNEMKIINNNNGKCIIRTYEHMNIWWWWVTHNPRYCPTPIVLLNASDAVTFVGCHTESRTKKKTKIRPKQSAIVRPLLQWSSENVIACLRSGIVVIVCWPLLLIGVCETNWNGQLLVQSWIRARRRRDLIDCTRMLLNNKSKKLCCAFFPSRLVSLHTQSTP